MELVQPPDHHLAQLNVARALDDLDSPLLADFVAALDRVNAVAERSPGFVWRLKDEGGNALDINVTDDARFIVNMSVWETAAHLEHFVWNTIHKRVYAKKSKWFEVMATPHFVMCGSGRAIGRHRRKAWRASPISSPTVRQRMRSGGRACPTSSSG